MHRIYNLNKSGDGKKTSSKSFKILSLNTNNTFKSIIGFSIETGHIV